MNVAHVLSSLHVGGGERLTLDLASAEAELGHRIVIVSLEQPPDGRLAVAFAERGIEVARVAKRPGFDSTLVFRLASLLRRRRVDVAHLHNRLALIYGAAAGRLAGAAVVLTRHGPGAGTPKGRWMMRGATRLLHAYVAVSPEIGLLERERGYCPPEKISVIENGIDLAKFANPAPRRLAARKSLGIPSDAWVMGSLGRIAVEKDYPFLVRAAAPMLGENCRLVIVGDGAEMPTLKAEIAARGVEPFVSLPGMRDDVPELLAALDVFVLSSRMEGLPLVVLESMASGLPVVATAVGGLPKLLTDGHNGFLVPPGDETALRQRLVALRADPATARAVGERGHALARKTYSRERMVERYLDLYRRFRPAAS